MRLVEFNKTYDKYDPILINRDRILFAESIQIKPQPAHARQGDIIGTRIWLDTGPDFVVTNSINDVREICSVRRLCSK